MKTIPRFPIHRTHLAGVIGVLGIFTAVCLGFSLHASLASAEAAPLLYIDPPGEVVQVGSSYTATVTLTGISNVYGIQMDLSYDPGILEVVGSAVTPGDCPQPDFVVANTATGGSISYAATTLSPNPPTLPPPCRLTRPAAGVQSRRSSSAAWRSGPARSRLPAA